MDTKVHIDISPSKEKKRCQNCEHFSKYRVHMGICGVNNKWEEKMDYQRCKKFEIKTTNDE